MPLILVVDDDAFMRMRASRVLTDAGFDVVEAANGALAVEAYIRERPDVVLMDITMPEMDGLEALTEIRKHDPTARVAMLTAIRQQAIVLDALKRGALDFIVKPFVPGRILTTVTKLLSM